MIEESSLLFVHLFFEDTTDPPLINSTQHYPLYAFIYLTLFLIH